MSSSSQDFDISYFLEHGFSSPVDLIDRRECKKLLFYSLISPSPLDWHKGLAVSSVVIYKIANSKTLVDNLSQILGDNIILWGAQFIKKKRGSIHGWHSDIESYDKSGKSVSIWIGINNVNADTSLKFISRSHRFVSCIQKVAYEKGKKRTELNDSLVEQWANEIDPESGLTRPDIHDGQAIIFDGSVWHASDNISPSGTRTALLLQYASADTPIRIFNTSKTDWPFEYIQQPKPPSILLRGKANEKTNRIVPAPLDQIPTMVNRHFTIRRIPRLTNWIRKLPFPLDENKGKGWQPYNIFRGQNDIFNLMNCHISVLSPGCCPHPPHRHPEEEILVMLSGEADVLLHGYDINNNEKRHRLTAGSFAYYPAEFIHTIDNTSRDPATYLMFKWRNYFMPPGIRRSDNTFVDFAAEFERLADREGKSYNSKKLMGFPTRYLGKLHSHITVIPPGGGYEPHTDRHDVAIIVLSGQLETLDTEVGPYDLIYYSAGEPHGMMNIGNVHAKYLVFEFHKRSWIPGLNQLTRSLKKRLPLIN